MGRKVLKENLDDEEEDIEEEEEDDDSEDDLSEDEEEEIVRSSVPANWHVLVKSTSGNHTFDLGFQSENIAKGMKGHWLRKGFQVELTERHLWVAPPEEEKIDSPCDHMDTVPTEIEPVINYRLYSSCVGEALRRIRKEEKLSLQQAVDKLNASPYGPALNIKTASGYSRLETGSTVLSVNQLFILATFFETTPTVILRIADRIFSPSA